MSLAPLTEKMLHKFLNEVYRVWKFFLDENLQLARIPNLSITTARMIKFYDLDLGAILESCGPL